MAFPGPVPAPLLPPFVPDPVPEPAPAADGLAQLGRKSWPSADADVVLLNAEILESEPFVFAAKSRS